jgi:hypothetical protein
MKNYDPIRKGILKKVAGIVSKVKEEDKLPADISDLFKQLLARYGSLLSEAEMKKYKKLSRTVADRNDSFRAIVMSVGSKDDLLNQAQLHDSPLARSVRAGEDYSVYPLYDRLDELFADDLTMTSGIKLNKTMNALLEDEIDLGKVRKCPDGLVKASDKSVIVGRDKLMKIIEELENSPKLLRRLKNVLDSIDSL